MATNQNIFSFLFIMVSGLCELVIDSEDSRCQRQELRAHHQGASRNVMVWTDNEGGKRQRDGSKKTANRHELFTFAVMCQEGFSIVHLLSSKVIFVFLIRVIWIPSLVSEIWRESIFVRGIENLIGSQTGCALAPARLLFVRVDQGMKVGFDC